MRERLYKNVVRQWNGGVILQRGPVQYVRRNKKRRARHVYVSSLVIFGRTFDFKISIGICYDIPVNNFTM